MRGTILIALGALLVTAQVAVAQQLGPGEPPPQARQVGKEMVRPAASRVDPAAVARQRLPARAESRNGLNGQIGGLPLTGVDLIVISGAALVMTGIGFVLQRMSAPRLPPGT